jgi:hypothetical protein
LIPLITTVYIRLRKLVINDNNENEDKTELIQLKREDTKDLENWRKTRKLGTLLGEDEEIKRRKQLALISLHKMKGIWKQDRHMTGDRKIEQYKAYIYPILTNT